MAETFGDHVGVFSCGNEESHVGVSQVVRPYGKTDGLLQRPGTRIAAARCSCGWVHLRELRNLPVATRVGRQVMGQLLARNGGKLEAVSSLAGVDGR